MDQTIGALPAVAETDDDAVEQIRKYLKPGQLALLASLLADLDSTTRYGDVTLVVADGRVQRIKQVRSF
jgi:hypothetical protein